MKIILCSIKKFITLNFLNSAQKIKTQNFFNFACLLIIILFITINSSFCNCSNIGIIIDQKLILRDLIYNGIRFKAHNSIDDCVAKKSFEAFRHHFFNTANLNFSISKYYNFDNGVLRFFEKKSPFSHPNINFGLFGDSFINYQLSHCKMIDFNFFSDKDLLGLDKNQNISNLISIYNKNLAFLNLNYNDLFHNDQYLNLNSELILDETKNSLKIQSFCDENKIVITDKTKKYLKL